MTAETKKSLNRAGVGLSIVGLLVFFISGGDLETGSALAGIVFTGLGTLGVLVREIGGLFK